MLEEVLQVAEPLEEGGQLGIAFGKGGDLFLELALLTLGIDCRLEGAERALESRLADQRYLLLRQVAGADMSGARHLTLTGLDLAQRDAQEGRLPGSVRANEGHALPVPQGQAEVVEQDPVAEVQAIYYYHAVTRGWGDIGYNYLADGYGNLYEGRYGGDDVIGAHTARWNTGALGVALLGCYDSGGCSPGQTPSAAALDATADRGAFVDVPWMPSELSEIVEYALGCGDQPANPQDAYRP